MTYREKSTEHPQNTTEEDFFPPNALFYFVSVPNQYMTYSKFFNLN